MQIVFKMLVVLLVVSFVFFVQWLALAADPVPELDKGIDCIIRGLELATAKTNRNQNGSLVPMKNKYVLNGVRTKFKDGGGGNATNTINGLQRDTCGLAMLKSNALCNAYVKL